MCRPSVGAEDHVLHTSSSQQVWVTLQTPVTRCLPASLMFDLTWTLMEKPQHRPGEIRVFSVFAARGQSRAGMQHNSPKPSCIICILFLYRENWVCAECETCTDNSIRSDFFWTILFIYVDKGRHQNKRMTRAHSWHTVLCFILSLKQEDVRWFCLLLFV